MCIRDSVNAVRATQDGSLQGFMNQAFNRTISQILGPIISEFNVRRDLTLGTAITPVMQSIVDQVDTPIAFTVDELTDGNLSVASRNNVISLLSNGQYDAAIAIIAANSKYEISEIEDRIYGIDTRFTTRVTYTNSNVVPNFQIGSNAVGWEGLATPSNRYGGSGGGISVSGSDGQGGGGHAPTAIGPGEGGQRARFGSKFDGEALTGGLIANDHQADGQEGGDSAPCPRGIYWREQGLSLIHI